MMSFKVNGQSKTFSGDGDMPILWYLRDELGLSGTKFGCGMALCGACTVHLDGKAIRSCVTTIASAAGKDITTIEGLDSKGNHPVQKAWREHNVPQCGFCQSGQIMQAASLLEDNASPSDQEIIDSMQGNICRCGTYQRIHAAVKTAAEMASKNLTGNSGKGGVNTIVKNREL
ncbi:(2Fe-2S)-binding protein [Thalassomonas haliotis]|uniref:(2Fe-2S)-binding protein n=1 Tax=Thalassomonas haliotis TaxID=485448 RepID=A0ABY7VKP5_9GAMM|nr:(2Fe-2S)-binding protein [Thalassomonas haliotis]WDE13764.1 (2Fe-2S)-binding protein [Thalassomonas haliotis]